MRRRVIQLADLHDARGIPIEMLEKHEGGVLAGGVIRQLVYGHNVRYVTDLTRFRLSDLINMERVGRKNARQIELLMARFGLLLRDGDPTILEHVKQDAPLVLEPLPEPEAPSANLSDSESSDS